MTMELEGPGWRVVTGPSAWTGDVTRFVNLTRRIAVMEFKLRFFGSVLGYVWQLMRPLLLFGVLLAVFTKFVKVSGDVPHYPVILLLGIVLYTFIAESLSTAVGSVVAHENLVRKIDFPRLVIPLSVVLTALFSLVLNLVVVAIFGAFSGVGVHWGLVEVPLLVAMLIVFVTGMAMTISALFVRFRDMQPMTDVFLQIYFYATPILYPLDKLSDTAQKWMLCLNPFACVLQQIRHAAITPAEPSAATVVGGYVWLAIPITLTVGLWVIGLMVFRRAARSIAEDL